MNDRVPTYPGRVKLTPVTGQTNTYDMTMADEPAQEGTPPTKANLLTDAVAALWGGDSTSKVTDILKYAAARYGTCTTSAATAAKVVTLSNFVLSVGSVIGVNFTYQNTASSTMLNVNGTGAKPIYCNGSVVLPFQITKTAYFQYDGTYWQLLNPEAKIATGSYVGSGATKTVSLAFTPHIFILSECTTYSGGTLVAATRVVLNIDTVKYMAQYFPPPDNVLLNSRYELSTSGASAVAGVSFDSATNTIYLGSTLNATRYQYFYTYF